MKAYKCDICGNLYSDNDRTNKYRYEIQKIDNTTNRSVFEIPDICDKCGKEIERFLKAKEFVKGFVRCKDCKYNHGNNKCLYPDSVIATPADYDFCSYGISKELEEDE